MSLQDARHLLSTTKGTQAKSEKLWGSYEKTIRFLREENRLLKNTVDEQHREKADLTRRLDQVSAAERESQIRIRHSADIEKHNEQVIKELKLALHHDRSEREKGSKEEGGEDKEVYRRKAEYFERELKECLLEVECLRAGLRALEGQVPMATSEQDDEHMTLRAQLTSAEKELRGLRQELQDRRSGDSSLRAHTDRMALEFNQLQVRASLLDQKVQALTGQNRELMLRNASAQSTFEDMQAKSAQVRERLEATLTESVQEVERAKGEAAQVPRLKEEIQTLKERVVAMAEHACGSGKSKTTEGASGDGDQLLLQHPMVTALKGEVERLQEKSAREVTYWKEQHTTLHMMIARDIGRYQASTASTAVTMQDLEQQLNQHKLATAEASDRSRLTLESLDLERKHVASLQSHLSQVRAEVEEARRRSEEGEEEVMRLRARLAEADVEHKTKDVLYHSLAEAKSEASKLAVQLSAQEEVVSQQRTSLELLEADKLATRAERLHFAALTKAHDELAHANAELSHELKVAKDGMEVLAFEKAELIRTLAAVSKQSEEHSSKLALARQAEVSAIADKLPVLQDALEKLLRRNSVLAADRTILLDQKQMWDEHMRTCKQELEVEVEVEVESAEQQPALVEQRESSQEQEHGAYILVTHKQAQQKRERERCEGEEAIACTSLDDEAQAILARLDRITQAVRQSDRTPKAFPTRQSA